MTFAPLYSVQREFNVSIDKLWHAWTDAHALEEWHHPVGMSCVSGATQSEMKIGDCGHMLSKFLVANRFHISLESIL